MYDPVLALSAMVLGVILGSFLNALSFRFNTGRSMGGRSRCMHCGHTLVSLDLVPIFSYLFLAGKCRYCEAKISVQYPLVEVLAGVLSFGAYILNPEPAAYAMSLLVWLTILFIGIYDMRHTVIPWTCSSLLMGFTVVGLFINGVPSLWAFAAGPVLALPLFLLSLVSGGRWMGWGDSAFELSLGWLLGVGAGLTALMLAVWSGALVGLLLIGLERMVAKFTPTSTFGKWAPGFTIKSEIPFAPFLALGAALAYFFHVDFFSTLPLLFS